MRWVGRETIIEHQSGTVAIEGYLQSERVIFFCKKYISVTTCYSSIKKRCLDKWVKRRKMFLSAITLPIYWGIKLTFWIGNAWWTPQKCAKWHLVKNSSCKFDPPCLLAQAYYFRQYNRLWRRSSPSKNLHRFVCSSRQRLLFKLQQAEREIWNFTEKRHVHMSNNPRSPQCQTEAQLLSFSRVPYFFVSIHL